MAYLGRQPIIGNYQVLDALTASATATYALTKNSVAVFPQTPANCIVSLNGVIQAPFSSYNISGSNIVFDSALTGSDSIDFITVLGDVLNVGTVSDGTIGLAKLSATGTKDATTFLRGDNTFAEAGGGSIVQTKYLLETATYSAGSASFVDLGSLSLSITPTSASNKILVHISIGRAQGSDNSTIFRFTRNGTAVGIGDAVGSRGRCSFSMLGENYSDGAHADSHSFTFIDEPSSTSALTYKLQQANEGGGTSYYNRTKTYTDSSAITHSTAHTTFILQEIVA